MNIEMLNLVQNPLTWFVASCETFWSPEQKVGFILVGGSFVKASDYSSALGITIQYVMISNSFASKRAIGNSYASSPLPQS